uniref:Transposase, MuDR, MULE transposase domain protein n=1 Tax=Tanacetum cinerariifolium TaxID=118510 RepID=A0A6L2L5S8_TANCI|nr:transposase, MuDR, MULE transposase domain protein [Tanacetum cinerariifolium]
MYRSHEKAKKDVSTMSFEELIAWEKKETQSPSYLRSPHVWKKTSASASKGKVLLYDFDDVANGKGKVLLDEFDDVGNRKGLLLSFVIHVIDIELFLTYPTRSVTSYKSDEMVIEVHFESYFFFCPLDYPVGQILDLRLPRSTRMSYKEMTDLLLDKTKDEIWKWFYCKLKCNLEKGLTLVENDRDYEKMFELTNIHGYLDVYVGHNPQVTLLDLYFKPLEVVCESDKKVTSKYRSQEKARKDSSTMSLEVLIAWEQKETQSPSYLRSPHVLKKTSVATSKGKVVLDDIEDVANGRGKVVLDDSADVGNGKVVFDE